MKNILYLFLALCASISLASCGFGENGSDNNGDTLALDSLNLNDFNFKTTKVSYKDSLEQNGVVCYYSFEAEVPISGPKKLVKSINSWINEVLGGSYKGNLNFGHEMLNHYSTEYFNGLEDVGECGPGVGFNYEIKITVAANTEKYVSFLVDSYEFTGGAHGMPISYGKTFVKEDGSELGWDIFADTAGLVPLFKESVVDYLTVSCGEQIDERNPAESFLFDDAQKKFPLPESKPWLLDSGIVIIYEAYEIAPYAVGSPIDTIPFDVAKKYLSDKTKDLIEPDKDKKE